MEEPLVVAETTCRTLHGAHDLTRPQLSVSSDDGGASQDGSRPVYFAFKKVRHSSIAWVSGLPWVPWLSAATL